MSADPLVTTRPGESLGDGFVERRGGHVERVCNFVQIMDSHCAGFEGHEGNLPYSPFVRLLRLTRCIYFNKNLSFEGVLCINITTSGCNLRYVNRQNPLLSGVL